MKNNVSLGSIFLPIGVIIRKYHLTFFIVVLVTGLSTAVMLLNNILQQSQDTSSYSKATGSTTFDQVTINRLKLLHTSNERPEAYSPGSGRISPFGE